MNTIEWFLGVIGRASWQAAVLVLVICLLRRLLGERLSPAWRCGLWTLVAVRLLVPVAPSTSFSIFNLAKVPEKSVLTSQLVGAKSAAPVKPESQMPRLQRETMGEAMHPEVPSEPDQLARADSVLVKASAQPTASANPTSISEPTPASQPTPSPTPALIHWPAAVFTIWLLGVALFSILLMCSAVHLHRTVSLARPLVDPALIQRIDECRALLRIRARIPVLESNAVQSPALYGFWRPKLLFPIGLAQQFGEEEQRFILLHELAHVKRCDIALNWIATLLQVLHWFNPLVWFAFSKMRADRELACDALVLSSTGSDKSEAYGRTILRLLANVSGPIIRPGLVGILEDKELLRDRIIAIARFSPARRGTALAMILMIVTALITLTNAQEKLEKKLPPVVPIPLSSVLVQEENRDWIGEGVWKATPRGTQSLDGIEFHIEGLAQLHGTGPKSSGRNYRERITIPLLTSNRVANKWVVANRGTNLSTLHLVGGMSYDASNGTKVAELVWRYSDGTFKRTPIEYNVHLRDWWRMRYEEPPRLPYQHTKVVWRDTHPDAARWGKSLRLYRLSLSNPEPRKTVRQLEFTSANARPTLFFTALTADPLKLGERPDKTPDLEEIDPPLQGRLQLTVQDAQGGAVTGAVARVLIKQGQGTNQAEYTRIYTNDPTGIAQVQRPDTGLNRMEITVSKEDFASRKVVWDVSAGDVIPASYIVKLKGGVDIGGTVLDEKGKAVPGASLSIYRFWTSGDERSAKGDQAEFTSQKHTTDADGRWVARNLPPEFLNRISIDVKHPDFMGTNLTVAANAETDRTLRAKTHRFVLKQGAVVRGRVIDDKDKPIEGATVWAGRRNYRERQETKTDASGSFEFRNVPEGPHLFSVLAKGRRPDARTVKVTDATDDIVFRLGPGAIIKALVQNKSGEPLSGTRVVLEGDGDIGRTYEFSTMTDAEGRFEWDGAPDIPLQFYFNKGGYQQKRDHVLHPGKDNVVVLNASRKVQGRVLDESTGKPIVQFRAAIGRTREHDGSFYADGARLVGFADVNGVFTLETDEDNDNAVQATVDGYAEQTLSIAQNEESIELIFRLKPTGSIEGVVVGANGRPVAGAEVLLPKNKTISAWLGHAQFEKVSSSVVVTTDGNGRFKLSGATDALSLFAVHASGFAEVSVAEVKETQTIVLQPFGRIEGILTIAGKVVAGQQLQLMMPDTPVHPASEIYRTETDTRGRFTIENVPPGKRGLVRLVQVGKASWHSHLVDVAVAPGQTTHIALGNAGTAIKTKVRFETPPADMSQVIVSGEAGQPLPRIPSDLSPDEIRSLINSDEWKRRLRQSAKYTAAMTKDGTLTIDSLPPGNYELNIRAAEPTHDVLNPKVLAEGKATVTVSADSGVIEIDDVILKPVSTQP